MRISDWSSDVCSSDLAGRPAAAGIGRRRRGSRRGCMEPNIFKYVWRHSRSEQVAILLIALASLPFYYLSLNLPKQIVNEGIQSQGFDKPDAEKPLHAFDLLFGEAMLGQDMNPENRHG